MTAYSSEELAMIAEAPMLVGMAVSMADLGVVSTAVEVAAMAREMAGAAEKYPSNTIIQAAFSSEALKSGGVKFQKPEVTPEEVQAGVLVDRAIAAVQAVVNTLSEKASAEEIQEYKAFVYACGEAVAKAAGSGLFGTGNPKVSDTEAAALTKLKTAFEL